MAVRKKRVNTTVESGGAETLVCAELMLRGIVTGRYEQGFHNVDVFCFALKTKRVLNISVKYRHYASATFFPTRPIRSPVDFVVAIRANLGEPVGDRDERELWVVPAAAMRKLERFAYKRANGNLGIPISKIPDKYLDAWGLIVDALR